MKSTVGVIVDMPSLKYSFFLELFTSKLGKKLGGLRLGGLGHKPPLSLTRAPHHTPSPVCVCSCV